MHNELSLAPYIIESINEEVLMLLEELELYPGDFTQSSTEEQILKNNENFLKLLDTVLME